MQHLLTITLGLLLVTPALAQFTSTSDGTDGALTFPPNAGVIDYVLSPGVDPDSDRVFHFTTITIPEGTTVFLTVERLGRKPIVWLATGDVVIDGVLELSGRRGSASALIGGQEDSDGGPGGGCGGAQRIQGSGPGGGNVDGDFESADPSAGGSPGPGTGGAFGSAASGFPFVANGVPPYGDETLVPLRGGSGGAGGSNRIVGGRASGGGGGGGAILIASTTRIVLNGAIRSNGGDFGPINNIGGSETGIETGGGGSGGGIRLVATRLEGNGQIRALGGLGGTLLNGVTNAGGSGRIRLEAAQFLGPRDIQPAPSVAAPGTLFEPSTTPRIRVTGVSPGGTEVPEDADGLCTEPTHTAVLPRADVQLKRIAPGGGLPPPARVSMTVESIGGRDKVTITIPPFNGNAEVSFTTWTIVPSRRGTRVKASLFP